ncbi:MAG: hypothetical protein ACPG5U_04940 [Planktomarina sp.]
MVRFFIILGLWFITACDSPTVDFAQIAAKQVKIQSSVFSIRQSGDRAQAIRTSTEYAPNWAYTAIRFAQAIEQATSCTIKPKSMEGDQALMEARLDCPYPTRANLGRQTESFDCYVWHSGDAFDCDWNHARATPGGP